MAQASMLLDRRRVVKALLKERGELLVVAGLGAPAWDATDAGDHPLNFPLWGGMGGALCIGLGLALAQPKRPVLVLTGDGELLMGLGSLATVGVQQPANLGVVVLDNERYGETGMQDSHTARGVDLSAAAVACGFKSGRVVKRETELDAVAKLLFAQQGPWIAQIKVAADKLPLVLPPRDGTHLKNRFREALLGREAYFQK